MQIRAALTRMRPHAVANRIRRPVAALAAGAGVALAAGAIAALAAGASAALAASGLPAHAASSSIIAQPTNSWNPSSVTISAGDSVTWSNGGGFHNVCVLKPGGSGDSCAGNPDAEFRNGAPSSDWSGYTNSFTFTTPGTYTFFCEAHKSLGMTGTITVQPASTGTSTTPPPESQPTETATTPTQTTTITAPSPADTTAPRIVGRPKAHARRTTLTLTLKVSEAANLHVTVLRRPPRAHAYSRIGEATVKVRAGRNTVRLPRRASGSLRRGAYRLRLQLTDAAGNRSGTATLAFKLR